MPDTIQYTEHAADVLARALDLRGQGQRFALVTSVDIQGGAAREVGSLAVVSEDGSMTGYMSNGCIDRDIQLQALQALQQRKTRVLRYGAGSENFDLKLPCGGALELLVDPSPDGGALQAAFTKLNNRVPAQLHFAVQGHARTACFEYLPKPRLALAGRGAVFRATADVAHSAGFELALYSPEAEDLDALSGLPAVEAVRLTMPQAAPALKVDRFSGFLTLFHDHDWEPALLAAALKTDAHFIGSLGSRRTHATRIETMRLMDVPDEDIARLNGPIGLVPSLRQAPLIAISAVAQLVEAFPRAILTHDGQVLFDLAL